MIVPVVEGQGEVQAFPVLLRRLIPELGVYLEVGSPVLKPRSRIVKEAEFKDAVRKASQRDKASAVIVLFDLDDDCARDHRANLDQWAGEEIGHLPCAIVMARREYEAWFLANLASLQGKRHISQDAEYPSDPEVKRGAKSALEQFMPRNIKYSETADQAALSAEFDLAMAYQGASSFRKLVREVCRILTVAGQSPVIPEEWESL